ncbi:MAG TPA: helix-turn-helix domain-containing protein [Dermatophilaceae bacterium]|jgi:excisionase family DNA binding protein
MTTTAITSVSAQQVAAMTGMSVDWIWKQCRDGKIAHHKLGSKYRFTEADLTAMAARSAVAPTVLQDDLVPVRGAS